MLQVSKVLSVCLSACRWVSTYESDSVSVSCCSCPGAGKWVEGDGDSRASYAQRTQV